MRRLALGLALVGVLEGAQLRLSEIEWAEDVNREALWEAFGRCAALPGPAACREREQARFTANWVRQKATIEAKYEQMLKDFEARCQASITRGLRSEPVRPLTRMAGDGSARRPTRKHGRSDAVPFRLVW